MPKHSDPHGDWEVRVDLVCLLCTRTAATARGPASQPFVPTSIRLQRPEDAKAVQRMRCPYCSGRLCFENRETVYVYASHRQPRLARVS
jgi:DNA-directed RNA polymerase subunit RPC12/RpoP